MVDVFSYSGKEGDLGGGKRGDLGECRGDLGGDARGDVGGEIFLRDVSEEVIF